MPTQNVSSSGSSVRHQPERGAFTSVVDGLPCVLEYRLDGRLMTIFHTEVAPVLQGRGIAAELTRAALEHARAERLRVRPACSYARAYFQRHPEMADLLG